ncbi:MAG: hypothetical protein IID34_09155 [Planctomycetes bacterium]|nr:hypothetical protein [Planctomycetota bacterium]
MAKKTTTARELQALITSLQQQRQAHLDALAEIDSAFAQFGIKLKRRKSGGSPRKAKRRVAKKVAKRHKRKARRTRKMSGPQSILNFMKRAGKNGVTGAEIVRHWNAEGRAGKAYTAIGKLIKAKKLKRRAVKGERGSQYSVT